MNKRNYELTLNVTTGKIKIPSISIYNTDKGIFNIKLFLEKGEGKNILKLTHDEMVNYKALFQAVKSKTKNYVELEGILDETENFFYYDLGSKFNDQVGVYNCQIFVTDTKGTKDNTTDDEIVTSVPFNYSVTASILTGLNAEITANPDLPVLKELINECKILMKLDSADMSVLNPFQKKEDNAINGTDKNIISNINNINSQIKEITNKVIEVNAKDFGASGDGIIDDTNSFSEFIDYINNNKDNIHKVVVPTGKYRINQGFRLEFLKDLQIIIEGEIITNGNDFLEFYFCENLKIKSNKISGKTNDDISLLVSTAIKFTNCCFIDFSFSNINNFKNAVYLNAKDLQPTHTLRGTYNLNITFDHINNCYNGIFILRENETAWINENRFFGGSFSGYNCIVQGDSNATIPCKSSEYNRNTFENISFEQIENNAITFYQSNCCVVKNCRPENPRVNEKYLIYEGLGAKSNLYDFGTSPIETNLIKMNLVDNVGSILIADIRKNTAIIGKKLYIYNSKMFIESCKISSESFEGRNICFSEDDYLIKIKNSDGVMKNYLKQNTLTYTITENDVDVNVSLLGSDNLTYREWQDDRIMITGRLKVNVETPKNTDLTLNLTLDSKLQPGISCYINSVAYNYATGESVAVCVSVLSNGHLKTNTAIPSGYIINFDSIVKKSYVNY